ncbi:hypothetical protein MRB53_030785 [Persea americana]|uniref:Uncharacterized protein n=1 Tax=Persea americana TaxID=3435 RepID=A0ACC2KM67_PERAE|nr:hypothetical protein MRB53_030785 [Persea americana]
MYTAFLFFSFFFPAVFNSYAEVQDCHSSCGPLADISYPFRLNQSPKTCGIPGPILELTCENNRTVRNFFSNRFYVLNISYDTYKIQLLDSVLPANNCSSLLSYNYNDNSSYSASIGDIWDEVVYVNCSVPVEDPAYVLVTPCNRSSSPHTPYLYAIMNNLMSITHLNTSCKVVMKIPASFGDRENATSYHEIESFLMRGFEVSSNWYLWRNCKSYCWKLKPIDRPSMRGVVEMLEGSVEHLQMPSKPLLFPQEMHDHEDHSPREETAKPSTSSQLGSITNNKEESNIIELVVD